MTTYKKILFLLINVLLSSSLVHFILFFVFGIIVYAIFNCLGINPIIYKEQMFFLDEGIRDSVFFGLFFLPVLLLGKFSILPLLYKMKIFYSFLEKITNKKSLKIIVFSFCFDILTNLLLDKLYFGQDFTFKIFLDFYILSFFGVTPCYCIFLLWHKFFVKNKK